MRRAVFAGLALASAAAWSQQVYKCPKAGGGFDFQDHPCAGAKIDRDVHPTVAAVAAPSSAPAPAAYDPRVTLAKLQKDNRIHDLRQTDAEITAAIDRRNLDMQREMDALNARKGYAKNNLAGATYMQSLSTEMTAVAEKYKAMNEVDLARQKAVREELATLQR